MVRKSKIFQRKSEEYILMKKSHDKSDILYPTLLDSKTIDK